MRVLVTGHKGYLGAVLAPLLQAAGHEVLGLDSSLFEGCCLGPPPSPIPELGRDVRSVGVAELEGIDAILHLAALSNDPLGNLNPDVTLEINHRATVALARAARAAGVRRFLFSSSCSIYGAADPEDMLDETAPFCPVTAYARSKVLAERDLGELADGDFCVVHLRNATAYGFSPQLRADLVVNNLIGWAFTTGEVMIKSDGTPWRPLVHVEDICLAFLALLDAPSGTVCGQAYNVGRNGENYQIRQIAELVRKQVTGSRIGFAADGGPDKRCYRVDFSKLERDVPGFRPRWRLADGVRELHEAYRRHGLTLDQLEGSRFMRIEQLRALLASGRLDAQLRWADTPRRTEAVTP